MAIWETGKYPFNQNHIRILGVLIRIIRAHFDPEIRDQLWILDRVYQKYPNKNFFLIVILVVWLP